MAQRSRSRSSSCSIDYAREPSAEAPASPSPKPSPSPRRSRSATPVQNRGAASSQPSWMEQTSRRLQAGARAAELAAGRQGAEMRALYVMSPAEIGVAASSEGYEGLDKAIQQNPEYYQKKGRPEVPLRSKLSAASNDRWGKEAALPGRRADRDRPKPREACHDGSWAAGCGDRFE